MPKVFKRRSSAHSAGSSISFLSDWFEHSFKASQDLAQDPSYQLIHPNPPDLEATKLADSVNLVDPMLQVSKKVILPGLQGYSSKLVTLSLCLEA